MILYKSITINYVQMILDKSSLRPWRDYFR